MTNYFIPVRYVAYLKLPSGEELEVVGEYQGGGSYTREIEDDGIYINEVDQPEFHVPHIANIDEDTDYLLTAEEIKAIKGQFIKQYWENVG